MLQTIIAIIALGIFLGWRFYDFLRLSRPKPNTVCPNCGKTKLRVPIGKYKCSSCGGIFEVNWKGEADIPTLMSIWGSIFLGFCLTMLFPIYFLLHWQIFDIVRTILFGFCGLLILVLGIRDLVRHKERFGSE